MCIQIVLQWKMDNDMGNWIKNNLITMVLFGIMISGVALILYPSFSDWWNSFHQSIAVSNYISKISNLDSDEYDAMLKEAEAYNAQIGETGIMWALSEQQMQEYNKILNIGDIGIMGYIDIPKIQVQLPIYHGTEEGILEVAVGHIAGTSLPVGGKSSHCIVSGHRGLPSARLFTDLDKLAVGDTWTLNVLDQTLTYEADQIRVVIPTDASYLDIEPGAVSVLGLINDSENAVTLLVDRDLLKDEYIGCHPCVNTSSLKLQVRDLFEKFLPATDHSFTEVTLVGEA